MAAVASSSLPLPLHEVLPQCRGWDNFTHRVFLITNETGRDATLETMKRENVVGTAMMGVSGFFILNMASVRGTLSKSGREIEQIIIFDRSLRTEHFWTQMKTILSQSSIRKEVIGKVKQLLIDNTDRYYGNESGKYDPPAVTQRYIKGLDREIDDGESWLSDDIKFARIKRIFDRGNFEFLRLDITDPSGFDLLRKQLAQRDITADTLYISNTMEYMGSRDEVISTIRSMGGLTQPGTFLVDTAARICHACDPLVQRTRQIKTDGLGQFLRLPPPSTCIERKPKNKHPAERRKAPEEPPCKLRRNKAPQPSAWRLEGGEPLLSRRRLDRAEPPAPVFGLTRGQRFVAAIRAEKGLPPVPNY